jgi:abortive infection bacteriophage resistance protein
MPHRREARPRGTLQYGKDALRLEALIERLAGRGLKIGDRDKTARYLKHIGYFRLSPYAIPFQVPGTEHRFRAGTSFEDVLDLYVFDRALRLLVLDALERVEVAIRAALTDHMSTTYDDPHWYTDSAHFTDRKKHSGLLAIVEKTCEDRLCGLPDSGEDGLLHRSALEHYLLTYGSPALPPSWLMLETLTIGQLESILGNLRRRADRTAVARTVGVNDPILASWLRTYVRVRNICAHHGRLWNVGLGVYPAIPSSAAVSWPIGPDALPRRSEKRLYPVLVSLQSVLDTVSPGSSWAQRLHSLLATRPRMNLAGMGVPERWAESNFWARHLP